MKRGQDVKHEEVAGYAEMIATLRASANGEAIISANYLEQDLVTAAKRFWNSAEWNETLEAIGPKPGGRVLDYGAGRCITAAAFAREGCRVVALDINPSPEVGLGAIKAHGLFQGLSIVGVIGDGEQLMFPSESFDVVYCRESLHHAFDLDVLVGSLARVLKRGGVFYAYGDHRHPWWSSDDTFRRTHPAVSFGVNEHSYPESRYRQALVRAGLTQIKIRPVVPAADVSWQASWHYRLADFIRRAPSVGRWAYHGYVRAWLYRATGSMIVIAARK